MMRPSALLVELIAELGALGAADRQAILARFDPAERDMLERYLAKAVKRDPPSFNALAGLSPWLVESLAAARVSPSGLTLAARDALIEAERLLPTDAAEVPTRPKSLLQRLSIRGAPQ